MPNMIVTKTINSQIVKPGARWNRPMQELRFDLAVVCDSAEPERFHGEVLYRGRLLASTESFGTYERADRAAQHALDQKVIDLFGGGVQPS